MRGIVGALRGKGAKEGAMGVVYIALVVFSVGFMDDVSVEGMG